MPPPAAFALSTICSSVFCKLVGNTILFLTFLSSFLIVDAFVVVGMLCCLVVDYLENNMHHVKILHIIIAEIERKTIFSDPPTFSGFWMYECYVMTSCRQQCNDVEEVTIVYIMYDIYMYKSFYLSTVAVVLHCSSPC